MVDYASPGILICLTVRRSDGIAAFVMSKDENCKGALLTKVDNAAAPLALCRVCNARRVWRPAVRGGTALTLLIAAHRHMVGTENHLIAFVVLAAVQQSHRPLTHASRTVPTV